MESNEAAEEVLYVDRDHTWSESLFITCGLSLCITVDILQYSMPLAFLPSVLEDRGHSTIKIATAIGVYYWTGFLGGLLITGYKLYCLLYVRPKKQQAEVTEHATAKQHIWFLIFGLGVGTLTLFLQALQPSWVVHTSCRFLQGFAGAFIFFYTFLLSVALFKDKQQQFAMTCATTALNVAEVFGSFFGAALFDMWGQRAVFWFLGVVSMINQVFLVVILFSLKSTVIPVQSRLSSRRNTPRGGTPRLPAYSDPDAAGGPPATSRSCFPRPIAGAMDKLRGIMASRPLACSNVLITMAAVVKGSVEEMLPFHADHRWHMAPMEIGMLFCTIAIAYIISAFFIGHFWDSMEGFQVSFVSFMLLMLGIVAWLLFAVVTYWPNSNVLSFFLVSYGVCLGFTVTPSALMLAPVVDQGEGVEKEVVNGLWNTTWEAGGSLGFLLGGLLAARYHEQMGLLTWYAICCAACALAMVTVAGWPDEGLCWKDTVPASTGTPLQSKQDKSLDYGARDSA
jgi:MFS family permease